MVKYKIKVKNPDGKALGEFETFKDVKFGKRLNDFGTASFAIPVISNKAADLIFLRRYTIEIYREDDLVWAGEQARRTSRLTESENDWATIINYDWLEQLRQARTDQGIIWTGLDQGEIGWRLINGAFGITKGTIEATKERDRQYNLDKVYEMLINLTNIIDGFDFEITNYKVYNAFGTKGDIKTDSIIFRYGKNIKNVEIDEDFTNPINRAIVLGEKTGATNLAPVVRDNTELQAAYGVREDTVSVYNISEEDTFEGKGDALIKKYGLPIIKVSFDLTSAGSPNITQFAVGDVITAVIKKGIYDINRPFRVFGWDVALQNDNSERLSLILGDFTLL